MRVILHRSFAHSFLHVFLVLFVLYRQVDFANITSFCLYYYYCKTFSLDIHIVKDKWATLIRLLIHVLITLFSVRIIYTYGKSLNQKDLAMKI